MLMSLVFPVTRVFAVMDGTHRRSTRGSRPRDPTDGARDVKARVRTDWVAIVSKPALTSTRAARYKEGRGMRSWPSFISLWLLSPGLFVLWSYAHVHVRFTNCAYE